MRPICLGPGQKSLPPKTKKKTQKAQRNFSRGRKGCARFSWVGRVPKKGIGTLHPQKGRVKRRGKSTGQLGKQKASGLLRSPDFWFTITPPATWNHRLQRYLSEKRGGLTQNSLVMDPVAKGHGTSRYNSSCPKWVAMAIRRGHFRPHPPCPC